MLLTDGVWVPCTVLAWAKSQAGWAALVRWRDGSEEWAAWLAGKKRLRRSSRERIEQIGRHWLLPVLGEVPLERLNGGHCAALFERIERINAAITAQRAGGRAWLHVEDDVRNRPKLVVSNAAQHRVYAALREFCNYEMKVTNRLDRNPVYAVELPPEVTPEAQRWSAAQAAAFLAASSGDPLHLVYRIVLLRGARRGEAVDLRWSSANPAAGYVRVDRPILLIGKDVTESAPKTRSAGLPVIKLHEGRHSAASLARDAAADPEIRRKTLGHADAAMTSYYTHIEAQAHRAAAEAVAALVDRAL